MRGTEKRRTTVQVESSIAGDLSTLAASPELDWPAFEAGDEVVLRDHPDAQVFTIIAPADDPVSNGGVHYFARTESGGTVFLDPAKIQAAPATYEPTFAVNDRVRVMTDAVPSSAPRGATGVVREVENGFVYVKLDHSFSVFPFKVHELVALTDVPVYRKVIDRTELRRFPAGTVLVHETYGTAYVKSFEDDWVCPGAEEYGPYNGAMSDLATTGSLLVVHVPWMTQD
ncbi:hypothetical protein [Umezawaea sp. Da 62-37]|uniref:hypothetical protein n=1 Tax=Umezawaea sp. Da 62-37 TaxID=3075927 RepID=UPI0028F707D0|nr:hypothetical protein [Umezawaea sp. Da 62-37]WNV90280.1 hypothetical protein RM788_18935 [Umezawaea sp. Da 62-37]